MTLEQTLHTAARHIGEVLRRKAFSTTGLSWKSRDDPVTDQDVLAEHLVREAFKPYGASFVGEELGEEQNGSRMRVLVDPIDGTKSYVRGEFNSALSIAIEQDGELTHAAVHDFMRDILYYADSTGAYVFPPTSDERILLPRKRLLRKPTIALDHEAALASLLLPQSSLVSTHVRSGSVALSYAQLAAGMYEALIMNPYHKGAVQDIAAGTLLLQQSGHVMTDRDGNPFDYRAPFNGLVAYHPQHRQELREVLLSSNDSRLEKALAA